MIRAAAVRDKKCNKRMALPGLNYRQLSSRSRTNNKSGSDAGVTVNSDWLSVVR